MAAALMEKHLRATGLEDLIEVESAGVYAVEGAKISSPTIGVIAKRGLDISAHRAHALDINDIKNASLILVMEESHRRSIFHNAPQYLGKVFLLSEMSGQHSDVKDPINQPDAEYERCASELEQLIESGMYQILRRLGIQASD